MCCQIPASFQSSPPTLPTCKHHCRIPKRKKKKKRQNTTAEPASLRCLEHLLQLGVGFAGEAAVCDHASHLGAAVHDPIDR